LHREKTDILIKSFWNLSQVVYKLHKMQISTGILYTVHKKFRKHTLIVLKRFGLVHKS